MLLCSFHGKDISKGKQEKRQRKHVQEIEARRAATGEGSSQSFSRIGGQQVAGTPYVVLSGNLQPGQSSDPASGFQTVERRVSKVVSQATFGCMTSPCCPVCDEAVPISTSSAYLLTSLADSDDEPQYRLTEASVTLVQARCCINEIGLYCQFT